MTTSIDAADAGIRIVRTFAAGPDRLFAAWIRADEFRQWFAGHQVEVPADRCGWPATPGTPCRAVMVVPTGDKIHWDGEFLEVEPPHRLVFTISADPAADQPHDTVTVALEPDGPGTRMTFTQTGPAERHRRAFEQAAEGWDGFFDVIEELATGQVPTTGSS